MNKEEILNSNCDVRRYAAGNPNTPADVLAELAKDSSCDIRSYAAGNPNTPADVLTELAKDSDWYVRSSAAGNPNTPADVLTELAKDSNWYVRSSAEKNINHKKDFSFIVTDTYVSVQGTNHVWYKHNYPNVKPFYTCGCFCGSREQLLMRIYNLDNSGNSGERQRILDALDEKFKEVFNR